MDKEGKNRTSNSRPYHWKEIELWVKTYSSRLEGKWLRKIIIPRREFALAGFLKGEYVLVFDDQVNTETLLIQLFKGAPFLCLSSHLKWQASKTATFPPVLLEAEKTLLGKKLQKIEALFQEREILFWFDHSVWLHQFVHIAPQSILLPKDQLSQFSWNTGKGAPENPEIRSDFSIPPKVILANNEIYLKNKAYESLYQGLKSRLSDKMKNLVTRCNQIQRTLKEVSREPDWAHLGELLKSSLPHPPPLSERMEKGKKVYTRSFFDYHTQSLVDIPWELKWDPTQHKDLLEKFYHLDRRKKKRKIEAENQEIILQNEISNINSQLKQLVPKIVPSEENWSFLLTEHQTADRYPVDQNRSSQKKSATIWGGKTFYSEDATPILVGRNQAENRRLTFQVARGNDVWMHVRGAPGAHVVIPLNSKQTASLATLLDAAVLAIYYTHGKNCGSQEVDYTYKKYVKSIKNSTEVTYTANKTLLVKENPLRLRELLNQIQGTGIA